MTSVNITDFDRFETLWNVLEIVNIFITPATSSACIWVQIINTLRACAKQKQIIVRVTNYGKNTVVNCGAERERFRQSLECALPKQDARMLTSHARQTQYALNIVNAAFQSPSESWPYSSERLRQYTDSVHSRYCCPYNVCGLRVYYATRPLVNV